MNKYLELYRINLKHSYYRNGQCPDVQLVPSEECRALMNRFDLLIREESSTYFILFGQNNKTGSPLNYLLEHLRLSFVLKTKNPFFVNFTDIPFLQKNQKFWFSNLETIIDGNVKQLNRLSYVSEKDTFPVYPPFFKLALPNTENGEVKFSISSPLEENIEDDKIENILDSKLPVDLKNNPEGKYSIKINEEDEHNFVTSSLKLERVLGWVDIYIKPDTIINKNFPEDLRIQFNARETYWRYLFTNISGNGYEDFQIIDSANLVKFTPPKEVKLTNGTNALEITSDQKILLSEFPNEQYKLKFKKTNKAMNGNNPSFIVNLPVAGIHQIRPELIDKERDVFSNIYFHL